MGKYMRKCRGAAGEEVDAVEVTQLVGVRTRSRAASAAGTTSGGGVAKVVQNKKRRALPSATATEAERPAAAVGSGGGDDGASCYLQLRSRMLFKAPPSSSSSPHQKAAEGTGGGVAGHGDAPLAAVLSRCSSTASAQERSSACRSDAAEADDDGDHVPQGSATNSGCGRDRDRRETTPSSQAHGEVSDLESDLAGREKSGRSLPAVAAASPAQPVMPPKAEIEEFFAAAEAAEAAEARRFASRYDFDVVRGVPLDAGRFEWTPVVSI